MKERQDIMYFRAESQSTSIDTGMARTRKQPELPKGAPTIPPAKGIELIQRQIDAGKTLLGQGSFEAAIYSAWENTTKNFLEKAFGQNTPNVTKFVSVGKYGSFPMDADEHWWARHRAKSLQTQLVLLDSYLGLLRTEIELSESETSQAAPTQRAKSRKVFLVHGHDVALQQTVARFLEKLDLEAIILDEQPSQGRTLFQKFSDHSDVAFAIVLLTGDDIGGKKDTPLGSLLPRARQNVILEFGYFLGKFGPAAVCALYQSGVELPSDIAGIVYVPLEGGIDWRLKVGSELKAAGIEIDMNRIF